MRHKLRSFLCLALTLTVFVVAIVWAAEDNKPSGTVAIESTSVAVGVGVNWGDGILTLNNGRSYRFSLNGLEVGSLGVSKIRAEGKVYDLTKVSDFEGTYAAGEASIAVGGGPGAVAMRNQNGVVMELESAQQGAKLTVAAKGWKFSSRNSPDIPSQPNPPPSRGRAGDVVASRLPEVLSGTFFQGCMFKPDKAWWVAQTPCYPLWCAFMMQGGPNMQTLTPARPRVGSHLRQSATLQTTLYGLIEAIAAEVRPNEETLVTTIAIALLHSHRARFIGKQMNGQAWSERTNYLSSVTA